MTPEETKLIELEQAQSNVAAQVAEQGNKKAMQESYAAMEAQNQRIQEEIQKRESELQRIGMPTQPYQPAYSSPGMTIGERVGEIGQTASQSIKTVGSGVVGGLGNMMSDIGAAVRPIFKTNPMPVAIGYGGYHTKRQGLGTGIYHSLGGGDSAQYEMSHEKREVAASDAGERLGMGTMAATATLGGIAASVLATKIPGLGAMGGGAGGAIGKMIGARAAGAAVGAFALPHLAAPLLAYEAGTKITDAVQTRRETEGFLESSSFRFIGSGSDMLDPRMGKGASREKRQEISEFIRKSDIDDVMMSGDDMMNILEEGTKTGMFAGAGSDIEQFKKRFTEIKDNVREVAKTLNVSLEEGLSTMKELYGAGVDLSKTREISTLAAATGRVAGRTGSEMITLGLQGAEQFRGTGVDMDIGMRGTMMNLSAIRAARDAGTISKSAIEQAGGEEALAMRRTQRQVQFSQSEEGRSYMASFFDPSTGGMNMRSFEKAMGGDDMSISDLATQAAENLNDPAKLIKFESQQEQIASEMGKAFGGRGLQFGQWNLAMAEAKMMADQTGASREDSFRSIMLRKGISPQELEAMQGEMNASQKVFGASQEGARKERDRAGSEEAERDKLLTRFAAKLDALADKLIDSMAGPMNSMVNGAKKIMEDISDSSVGKESGDVRSVGTGTDGGISGGTMVSGSKAAQDLKKQVYGTKTRSEEVNKVHDEVMGPLDMTGGGGWLSKGSGTKLEDLIEEGAFGEGFKEELITTKNKDDLAVVTSEDVSGYSGRSGRDRDATYTGVSKKGAPRLKSLGRVLGVSDDDIKSLEEQGRIKKTLGGQSIKAAMGSISILNKFDPSKGIDFAVNQILEEMDIESPVRGEGYTATMGELNIEESLSVIKQLRTMPEFDEAFKTARKGWTQFQSGTEIGRTRVMDTISDAYKSVRKKISKDYRGMELSDKGLANIGRAQSLKIDAANEKDPIKKAALQKQAKDLISETFLDESKGLHPKSAEKSGMGQFFNIIENYEPKTVEEMNAIDKELKDLRSLDDPSNAQHIRRLELEGEVRKASSSEMLTQLGSISRGLVKFQGREAKDLFGEMLYSEMITNKELTADDVKASKNLIGKLIDNPLMISKLTKSEQELLGKTNVGQVLKDRGSDIITLKKEMGAAGDDTKAQKDAFDKAFGEMSETYFKQYGEDKNLKRIITAASDSTIEATVGTTKAAYGGATGDTSMKSSTELFQVMTASNWVVLGALQSIHSKLKD